MSLSYIRGISPSIAKKVIYGRVYVIYDPHHFWYFSCPKVGYSKVPEGRTIPLDNQHIVMQSQDIIDKAQLDGLLWFIRKLTINDQVRKTWVKNKETIANTGHNTSARLTTPSQSRRMS